MYQKQARKATKSIFCGWTQSKKRLPFRTRRRIVFYEERWYEVDHFRKGEIQNCFNSRRRGSLIIVKL